ncbi:MAG: trehalose-6-phosphate synthase [Chloroflexi bacterium]|nr:trehalose-6-phosphate synthase [Chloroflexota bacterium]
MATKETLQQTVRELLGDRLLVVVSNREPYIHTFSGDTIECQVPPSGLTTALDPVLRACGGTWIAHGSGDADRQTVDGQDRVAVPPDQPRYSLRRVWLSKEQEEGYYYGFANQALWPLCHISYVRPVFEERHWETYRAVNEIFADALAAEIGDQKAFAFIQDYHLALLPQLVKQRLPNVVTAQFWHIPWPNPEVFRICPWKEDILDGLLGNDLLGFHVRYHCNNFLETVNTIEAKVDYDRYEVTRRGRKSAVRPFPISVDYDEIDATARSQDVKTEMERLRHELGLDDEIVGLGLDRLDYTKGIPERLLAFGRFLNQNPKYRGKVVFIQAGVPSRTHIGEYKRLNDQIDDLVEELNWRYGSGRWKPVIYLRQHLSPTTLMALRRLARFAAVSSLHDGMNLVAKEFVASRFDEDGVLLLSPFTGAARELTDALLVNPYATDHFAQAIRFAIEMPRAERRRRMGRMRRVVQENSIYKWAADIITFLARLSPWE